MRYLSFAALSPSLPVLVVALALVAGAGCNRGDGALANQPPSAATRGGGEEAEAAQDGAWGDLKGQVVFAGDPPAPMAIEAVKDNKDKDHCQEKGNVVTQEWVVNKDTKGVRWVVVWLQPEDPKGEMPVHPDLKEPPKEEVVMDQPHCRFEPRVVALRQGQVLLAKNSAPVAHNFNTAAFPPNRSDNKLMPPNTTLPIKDLKASQFPVSVSCGIHPWMKGYVRIYSHPYFAVTDENGRFEIKKAPAGKYRLVIWHETGFRTDKTGEPVEVKAGAATDLGKFELKKKT